MIYYLISWLITFTLLEFCITTKTITSLSLLLCFVCELCILLGYCGLDLLAVIIVLVYSSVIIYLILILLYVKQSISNETSYSQKNIKNITVFFFACFLYVIVISTMLFSFIETNYYDELIVWYDSLTSELLSSLGLFTNVIHSMLMKTFVFENLVLNFLLILILLISLNVLKTYTIILKRKRVVTVLTHKKLHIRKYSSSIR